MLGEGDRHVGAAHDLRARSLGQRAQRHTSRQAQQPLLAPGSDHDDGRDDERRGVAAPVLQRLPDVGLAAERMEDVERPGLGGARDVEDVVAAALQRRGGAPHLQLQAAAAQARGHAAEQGDAKHGR